MMYTFGIKKASIYINSGRKKLSEIQKETGADVIINAGLYDMGAFKAVCHLKADGYLYSEDPYSYWGFGWNKDDTKLQMVTKYDHLDNYICCVAMIKDGEAQKLIYGSALGGNRGRTAVGTMPDGRIAIYCSKDGGSGTMTPEGLQTYLLSQGWHNALMLDGGGSSQCITPEGTIESARIVHNVLCFWFDKNNEEGKNKGMNLHKCFLTNNNCFKAGEIFTPKGIMVHSTGANNPNLKRYVQPDDGLLGEHPYDNHFNVPKPGGKNVCVHAFIGKLKDGTVATYQTLPWNYRGWHAGKNAGNDKYIGFEICEDKLTDAVYFKKVYQEAVELCVYLCKMFDLTEKDIICHSEGYKKGVASNHGDVMHWFPKHGKSMDTFRADVAAKLKGNTTTKPVTSAFEPYLVKITASELNVRAGAGTTYKVNMTVSKGGVYTIVAETNGWGKLKSGAGWIKLSYTKKI